METFLMVLKSITSMVIGLTTELKILPFLRRKITCGYTCKRDSKTSTIMQKIWSLLSWPKRLQKGGTLQKREESGTVNMHTIVFSNEKSMKEVAGIAGSPSLLKTKANPSIVVGRAFSRLIGKNTKQKLIDAWNAAKILMATLIVRGFAAPSVVRSSKETRVARVLNLVLENQNVYYANGVLVDNCADSFLYSLEMARRNGLVFIGNDKPVPTDRFWARREKEVSVMSDDDYYMSDDDGED